MNEVEDVGEYVFMIRPGEFRVVFVKRSDVNLATMKVRLWNKEKY